MVTNETVRYTLRLDYQLYEQIKKSSKMSKRSINKEMEYILTQYFNSTLTTK